MENKPRLDWEAIDHYEKLSPAFMEDDKYHPSETNTTPCLWRSPVPEGWLIKDLRGNVFYINGKEDWLEKND